MRKSLALLVLASCASDSVNPDDVPPFTNGVSLLSGSSEAGYVDGVRGVARFNNPVTCAYHDGKLYVADFDNSKIRVVDATTGEASTLIDQKNFVRPFGVMFAPDGTLYVSTDRGPNGEKGSSAGTIWRVSGTTAMPIAPLIGRPRGMAMIGSTIYASDYQNHVLIRVDAASGAAQTVAGQWRVSGLQDGVGGAALFSEPYGIVAKDGKLIVADYGNNALREVSPDGTVRTLAGNGIQGYADGAMGGARFAHPQGVAITNTGEIYVSDLENYRIRKVTSEVTTTAGDGTGGYADSDDLLAAELYGLEGICIEPSGSMLYVADGTRGEDVPFNRIRSVKLR